MTDSEVLAAQGQKAFKLVEVQPGTRIVCKVDNDGARPLVPTSLRRAIFDSYHRISHPGQKAMRKLLSKRYHWSRLVSDVDQ